MNDTNASAALKATEAFFVFALHQRRIAAEFTHRDQSRTHPVTDGRIAQPFGRNVFISDSYAFSPWSGPMIADTRISLVLMSCTLI